MPLRYPSGISKVWFDLLVPPLIIGPWLNLQTLMPSKEHNALLSTQLIKLMIFSLIFFWFFRYFSEDVFSAFNFSTSFNVSIILNGEHYCNEAISPLLLNSQVVNYTYYVYLVPLPLNRMMTLVTFNQLLNKFHGVIILRLNTLN